MEEKSISERFPYFFKLESGDLQWYESMGFKDVSDLGTLSVEIESAAKEYATKSLVNAGEQAVDDCAYHFLYGATWYLTNYKKLSKLPKEQSGNAIAIAQIKYTKDECEDIVPYEDWSLSDTYSLIYTIGCFYLDGVEWVKKQKDMKI